MQNKKAKISSSSNDDASAAGETARETAAANVKNESSMKNYFVVAGTYDRQLIAFMLKQVSTNGNDNDNEKIDKNHDHDDDENVVFEEEQVFAYAPHNSCVKCVAVSGSGNNNNNNNINNNSNNNNNNNDDKNNNKKNKSYVNGLMVTGSTDESLKVYNWMKKKEIGTLMHHTAPVTIAHFIKRKFLLSAGDDGYICIWRTHDWQLLSALKAHKGKVNSVAVHPSGAIALSIGHDRLMKLWDIQNGKCAYTVKLSQQGDEAHLIVFSQKGSKYAIVTEKDVNIYDTSSNKKLITLSHSKRVIDVKFLDEDHLISGGEDRYLTVWELLSSTTTATTTTTTSNNNNNNNQNDDDDVDVDDDDDGKVKMTVSANKIAKLEKHQNRVRSIEVVGKYIFSASSDGAINVWKSKFPYDHVYDIDTNECRITCLSVTEIIPSN